MKAIHLNQLDCIPCLNSERSKVKPHNSFAHHPGPGFSFIKHQTTINKKNATIAVIAN